MWTSILIAIVVLLALAVIFGGLLGFASERFKVEGNPLVEQIDSNLAATLRSDYAMLSLEDDVRKMVEVAMSYGWTVLPVNSSRTNFIYGAEVEGTGKVQHHQGVGAGSISTQQGNFRQVAPSFPWSQASSPPSPLWPSARDTRPAPPPRAR